MKKLRAVLAGCGGMSGEWLRAIAASRSVQLVGLVDLHEEAAVRRKEEHQLSSVRTGANLEKMLRETQPEMVFDCTIPAAHKAVTLTALRNGSHVLGEKPIAENLRDARKMIAAAEQAGRLYAVIQNRRYTAAARAVRKLVASGRLGRITTINSDFYIAAHFGGFRDEMRHVLLLDMAIHTFDLARFLSGADPLSVFCHEWNPPGSWYSHGASAAAIFQMTEDIVYNYRGSWCSEGMHTSWQGEWRIVGENGTAMWDGEGKLRAQIVKKRGSFLSEFKDVELPIRAAGSHGGHAAIIEEFARCVRTGQKPETICTDNVKSFAMTVAAVESASRRRPVRIGA